MKKSRTNYTFDTKLKLVKRWISGQSTAAQIQKEVGVDSSGLSRWRDRFVAEGLLTAAEAYPFQTHQNYQKLVERASQQVKAEMPANVQPKIENKMEILELKDKLLNAMMENATLRTRIAELESLLGNVAQPMQKTKRR